MYLHEMCCYCCKSVNKKTVHLVADMLNCAAVNMMPSGNWTFSPSISNIAKAFAIVMMIILHYLTWGSGYISGIVTYEDSQRLLYLSKGFQLCVAIYAFLTGWTYFHHSDKSYRYSLKKIISFLLSYWIVFLICFLIAVTATEYRPSIWDVLNELWPDASHPLMCFAWYVCFYVKIMLLLPLIPKIERVPSRSLRMILFVLLAIIALIVMRPFFAGAAWAPTVVVGYYTARFRLLEGFSSLFGRWGVPVSMAMGLICMVTAFIIHLLIHIPGVNVGIVAAPLFCVGIMNIFVPVTYSFIRRPLNFLGKKSMNVWFFHCLFFSGITSSLFYPVIFSSGSFFIPLLLIIFVSLILSIVASIPQKLVVAWISKCLPLSAKDMPR